MRNNFVNYSLSLHLIYMYICVYIYTYIHIYTERERERKRTSHIIVILIHSQTHTHTYKYICIYRVCVCVWERENKSRNMPFVIYIYIHTYLCMYECTHTERKELLHQKLFFQLFSVSFSTCQLGSCLSFNHFIQIRGLNLGWATLSKGSDQKLRNGQLNSLVKKCLIKFHWWNITGQF